MIINLFVIFDPCTSVKMELNWISIIIVFYFCYIRYYCTLSLIYLLLINLLKFIYKGLNVFLRSKFSRIYFSLLIVFVFIYNFLGLFPYIYTISRHITFTLSFSLSFWLGFIIYGWLNFCNVIFAHIVPLGTPFVLIPFLVLIETIRLIIRPLTLSVRLAANIIAGHLLLCLVGSLSSSLDLIFFFIMLIQFVLYLLEVGVSLIQAYVYSILLSLYRGEVDI